jgi:hypothetical protein
MAVECENGLPGAPHIFIKWIILLIINSFKGKLRTIYTKLADALVLSAAVR